MMKASTKAVTPSSTTSIGEVEDESSASSPPPSSSSAAATRSRQPRAERKATKRRRRMQGPNPANTWQQQPSVKSPAARARAYLLDAGLYTSKSTMHDDDGDNKSAAARRDDANTLLDPALDLNSPEVKFGRMLGGTDQRSRHRAVAKLGDYLRARCDMRNVTGGISELDMMKLWKGMWYTLYMADRVPVQDELSKRLAELIWCFAGTEEEDEYAGQVYLDMDEGERDGGGCGRGHDSDDEYEVHMEEIENTLDDDGDNTESSDEEGKGGDNGSDGDEDDSEEEEEGEEGEENEEIDDALQKHCRGAHLAALYVRTFFRTMRREWGNVDKHRVDKFYTAMRLMIAEVFKYMAKRHWNLGIIRLFNDTLHEEVLAQTPNGLRYHLIDISLPELAKANKEADLPLTEATFLDCLEPYFALAQSADDKIVQSRVMENVLTRFLTEYSVVSDNADEDGEDNEASELIFREVHVGSVAKFIFEVASDGETEDRYRAGLYELHKTYLRKIAAVGRDVDMQDGGDDEDEEEEEAAFYGGELPQEFDESASDNDDNCEEEEEPEPPKKVAQTPLKAKSGQKRKKKRKNSADENDDDDENVTSEVVDPSAFNTPEKSSKKAAKTKKNKQKADSDEDDEDDVVNISVKEQKQAAKAQKKKQKKVKGSESTKTKKKRERKLSIEEEEEERRKRVSFGKVNHSKSYKASMKDLRKRDVPSTALLTPDRSILLTPDRSILLKKERGAQSVDGKSKKAGGKGKRNRGPQTEPRKRRAVDYF